MWMREQKILELARVAEQEGFAAIYPSDDDDLDWKERPCT
jgi:poly(3-hydroxybutyrate) depolymerase